MITKLSENTRPFAVSIVLIECAYVTQVTELITIPLSKKIQKIHNPAENESVSLLTT